MSVIICRNCGKKYISDTDAVCPECGCYYITNKKNFGNTKNYKCPKCGEKILQPMKYCPACRFPLDMIFNGAPQKIKSEPFYKRFVGKFKSIFKNHKAVALFSLVFLTAFAMRVIIISTNDRKPTPLNVSETTIDTETEEPKATTPSKTDKPKETQYACATQTVAPNSFGLPQVEHPVMPAVPYEYGARGGLDGYWYDYQADMEIHSSVMYFTEDGSYYRKTWRQIDAGTYYVNDSSVFVRYDSYFNYAGTDYYEYLDTCSATYEFKGNNIVGFKYIQSDAIDDKMLNETIKNYAAECSRAKGLSEQEPSDALNEYSGHCIKALYQYDPYKVYNNIGITNADVSGDDVSELLAIGITDDKQIGYIEIYKLELGVLFRILAANCLEYNDMSIYPVMLYGDYYICCDSSSPSNGYKKSVYGYSDITHSWYDVYNTEVLFNNTGNQIKGYIVNDELVSKTQYDQFNHLIERGRRDIFDFRELNVSKYNE